MTDLVASDLVVRRGAATLLERLSLSLSSPGAVALIGPNGAGKSTLLRILAGIEAPHSGTVRVGDRNLESLPPAVREATIGYLPQHFDPYWDLTVADLVQLGAARGAQRRSGAIEGSRDTFELAALWRRRWSTLSGGERARALLAMVLVVDPPILLADEPAAALDIRHRLDVIRTLGQRGGERLSVVVVHDLDLAFRFFDRVVMVDRGRIVADAPAQELIADPLLDRVFAVRFERLKTADGWLLRPMTEDPSRRSRR